MSLIFHADSGLSGMSFAPFLSCEDFIPRQYPSVFLKTSLSGDLSAETGHLQTFADEISSTTAKLLPVWASLFSSSGSFETHDCKCLVK